MYYLKTYLFAESQKEESVENVGLNLETFTNRKVLIVK